ncbi:tetratricopeptide repeat protein [Syntrophus aciditrophicus]|uniref:Fog:tpr repeat protein n=1 Tax=Syntrophus aciditrophicus (strain SB) TaxID=56780 RepID=Q2LY29_SYNAS|nr:tetratricopeptide repeat protein [Syntrophus aciditrophicus]ABC78990.1 fog:tpr repeat protein [Syntrophus aciditrophicus SB]
MEKGRKNISSDLSFRRLLILPIILFIVSCTLPRIAIIDDPLSAEEHNDLGVIYEQKGKLESAEREYRRAIKKKKDWAVPYFNLGNVSYKKGNYREAEDCFRKALSRDENNARILNNLALLLYEQGKDEESERLIEKALSIEKTQEYLDTYQKIREKRKF